MDEAAMVKLLTRADCVQIGKEDDGTRHVVSFMFKDRKDAIAVFRAIDLDDGPDDPDRSPTTPD
ncbi:hypothetical protein [Methylobacterium sp. WL19]|uniref:hypothetical protein n=1 Tax=Methylobacterium sp. WL19 TaxID=2603896 RepID=UPI0011CC85BD|nr:hypothetical protein [Methylobacterium sp. WL19]TXN33870.1 hypothetical protein FV220_00005 [Methylobacterium sp. WL19]